MEEQVNKIVELEIDIDNIEMADLGVEVVSLVENPAIEIDFLAFAAEGFVTPNAGESEDDFIGRCIPKLMDEGYDQEAAIAICYGYWQGKQEHSCSCSATVEFTKEQEVILEWAKEHGELITEDYTVLPLDQEFASIGDVTKAIQGLDILSKLGIKSGDAPEIKYRYVGPSDGNSRDFCRAMIGLNKMFTAGFVGSDMDKLRDRLAALNPNQGPGGANDYDVFSYKGGRNCRHYWEANEVFREEGQRAVLVIPKGPADGRAGKTNNKDYKSPSGSVRRNAAFTFQTIDDEKRIVAGPMMVPNRLILRRDFTGEPYYVFFSKETIRKIQEKYNKELRQNYTDVQHDGNVITENVMLEQWIIEHPSHDKSRFYGFDYLPLGTWFGVYKINNEEQWQMVKDGDIRGFSVAGNFIEAAKPVAEDDVTLSKIIDILKKVK